MITEAEIFLRLLAAAGMGAIIGFERERNNQPAGLRTHIILVIGSALAMTLSINLAMQFKGQVPNGDPSRLAAQVLSGIGFLGAGAILRYGVSVKGLTTATSMWTMAVVGLAVGAGYILVGAGVTGLLLAVLWLLTKFEARFVHPKLPVSFTLILDDQPGLVANLRKTLQAAGAGLDNLSVQRRIRHKRMRIDMVVRVQRGEQAESLAQILSAQEGTRSVRYE